MGMYKQFITLSTKRKIRKDLMYQVIMDDICDIFGADETIKEQIKRLIEGKELAQPVEPSNG
jgi:hypothetical protein